MVRTPQTDLICAECTDRALFAHGTAQIFLARSIKYRNRLRLLSFVGLAGPLLVGAVVIHGLVTDKSMSLLLPVVGIVSVAELLVSAWSLAASWAENLSYSQRSTAENLALSSSFREVAQRASNPPDDLEVRFADLRGRDEVRRAADADRGVTNKEKRYGLHAGLLHFQRECVTCKVRPVSMDSTNCKVCGEFEWWRT